MHLTGKKRQYLLTAAYMIIPLINISVSFPTPRWCTVVSPTCLFGIEGFRTWLQTQFPDAMTAVHHAHFYREGTSARSFDHVLIDVNHFLHIVVRRSNSHTHALQLLIQELDKCTALATPTSSLVLALDGPPCAAKLNTQRQRRLAIIKRSLWLRNKLPSLINSMKHGSFVEHGHSLEESARLKAWKRRLLKDQQALCITPGHLFMHRAAETCLQWASTWSARRTTTHKGVHVYVSSTSEPGEGEVKLLNWLIRRADSNTCQCQDDDDDDALDDTITQWSNRGVQPHHTVAFIGGDSDLVLLGLAMPTYMTPNIFVILPSSRLSWILSLTRISESIAAILSPIHLNTHEWYKTRLDLILLFIMNGNDYLPKLRGSPGLEVMFQTYIRLVQSSTNIDQRFFFRHAETQSFNIPFCQAYFSQLTQSSTVIQQPPIAQQYNKSPNSFTPLSCLQNLVNIGIVPGPITFYEENNTINTYSLSLGGGGGGINNKQFHIVLETSNGSQKKNKQILAQMALESLFGNHSILLYMDPLFSLEEEDWKVGLEALGYSSLNSELLNHIIPMGDTARGGVVSDTVEYCKGLQWNLKMYQEGICADYSYDYGRRLAPTVYDLMDYFNTTL